MHPLNSADISIFSPETNNFRKVGKSKQKLHFKTFHLILLTFIEYLKIILISIIAILMMLAIMATPDLPGIKVFWKQSYDTIISVHDIAIKILSRDSTCIMNVFM